MAKYVSQINGSPIFATRAEQTKSGVDIDAALSGIANGVFEIADLDPETHEPDVDGPSHKIIYLTKESGSSKTDPYTEWIYTQSNTWEVIGETSIDLSGYKTKQTAYTAPGLGAKKTITALSQNENGEISATASDISIGSYQIFDKSDTFSSTGTAVVTGRAIADALGDLNAAVTSSGGSGNVVVKVTEGGGKITAVNITTDNTENKNNKVTSWSSTPSDKKYPSEKLVKDTIDALPDITVTSSSVSDGTNTFNKYVHPTDAGNKHIPAGGSSGQVLVYGGSSGTASWSNAPVDNTKADKVDNATSGNFAGLDSNGNLTDSTYSPSSFATSAQGSKADSAIQGVKVNGTSLTPDSSMVVDIIPATSAAYGVVQLGYVDL